MAGPWCNSPDACGRQPGRPARWISRCRLLRRALVPYRKRSLGRPRSLNSGTEYPIRVSGLDPLWWSGCNSAQQTRAVRPARCLLPVVAFCRRRYVLPSRRGRHLSSLYEGPAGTTQSGDCRVFCWCPCCSRRTSPHVARHWLLAALDFCLLPCSRGHVLYFEARPRAALRCVGVEWGLTLCSGAGQPLRSRDGQSGLGGFIAERSFRQSDRIRVNERIRAREIRVIDDQGGQLGVMQPFEAIKLAKEKGLDLVEISPTSDPPVCKITDYDKHLYQANKNACK